MEGREVGEILWEERRGGKARSQVRGGEEERGKGGKRGMGLFFEEI